jgi:hypothetical protein
MKRKVLVLILAMINLSVSKTYASNIPSINEPPPLEWG